MAATPSTSTLPTSQHAFGQDNFISFHDKQDSNQSSKSKSTSQDRDRVTKQSQSSNSNGKGKKRKLDDREEPLNPGPNGWGKAEELKAMARGTPWTREIQWAACRNAPEMLHRELMAFDSWISPTFEEHETRVMVIELISQAIRSNWPDAKVHSFGSHDTKLYLPQGDIDIVILSNSMKSQNTPNILSTIASLLRKANLASNIQVLSKARVPIIKFVCNHGKYKVDISLNLTNGITACNFVNGWLRKEPAIRPLIMFVKHLLDQRGLSEVFTGGLGSYSVILMAVSFFQTHPKLQRREISAIKNLGVLLLDMLELYGINYGYDEVGISVNRGGYFRKDSRSYDFFSKPYKPFSLSIEDPQDPTNDISRGSYNLHGIREAFAGALNQLTIEMCRRGIEKQKTSSHQRFGSDPRDRGTDRDEEARREILKQNQEIKSTGKDPMSLLGNVLGVTKEVINQRKNIHELYHSGILQHKLNRPPPSMHPQPGPASSSNSREKAYEESSSRTSKPKSSRPPSPSSLSTSNGRDIQAPSGPRAMQGSTGGYSIAGRAAAKSNNPRDDIIRQAERASDIRPTSRGNGTQDRSRNSIPTSRSSGSNRRNPIDVDQSDEEELDSKYSVIGSGSNSRKKVKLSNGNGLSRRSDSYISHDSDSASFSSLNEQGDDDGEISFPTMLSSSSRSRNDTSSSRNFLPISSTSRFDSSFSADRDGKLSDRSGVRKVLDLQPDRKSSGNSRKVSRDEKDAFWNKKGNVDPGVDEYDHWASYLDQQGDH